MYALATNKIDDYNLGKLTSNQSEEIKKHNLHNYIWRDEDLGELSYIVSHHLGEMIQAIDVRQEALGSQKLPSRSPSPRSSSPALGSETPATSTQYA